MSAKGPDRLIGTGNWDLSLSIQKRQLGACSPLPTPPTTTSYVVLQHTKRQVSPPLSLSLSLSLAVQHHNGFSPMGKNQHREISRKGQSAAPRPRESFRPSAARLQCLVRRPLLSPREICKTPWGIMTY